MYTSKTLREMDPQIASQIHFESAVQNKIIAYFDLKFRIKIYILFFFFFLQNDRTSVGRNLNDSAYFKEISIYFSPVQLFLLNGSRSSLSSSPAPLPVVSDDLRLIQSESEMGICGSISLVC